MTLIQYPPAFSLPSASPFCLKVETYCRMAKIEYENQYVSDPRISPTGKLPIMKKDGKVIPDSTQIINELKKTHGDPLDEHLSDEEKAQALAWQRLLEEHLYWYFIYYRWLDPVGWKVTKKEYFAKMGKIKRGLLAYVIRKKLKRDLKGQGLGVLPLEAMTERFCKDIDAIATFLGDKHYFMGEKPSSIDACVYATLANIAYPPFKTKVKKHFLTHSNLINYCSGMRATYWPNNSS